MARYSRTKAKQRATYDAARSGKTVSAEPGTPDALVILRIDPSRRPATAAVVRSVTGLSRKRAEAIIDTHEAIECVDEDEAESLMAELEGVGATVELVSSPAEGGR